MIRLFGNQYLGFWLMGLVLFALQEIPNMIMPLFKLETNLLSIKMWECFRLMKSQRKYFLY